MMHFLPVFHISPLFSEYVRVWEHSTSPISRNLLFPLYFEECFCLYMYFSCFSLLPSLTMMLVCIIQCTYWTPLIEERTGLYTKLQNVNITLRQNDRCLVMSSPRLNVPQMA